jgi:iron complex outermembrane receptor protein
MSRSDAMSVTAVILAAVAAECAWAQSSEADGAATVMLSASQDDANGEEDEFVEGLEDLDLEQLMGIQVTSVAGRAQALLDTPAAITVITGDELRRTGHRNIAEALRLVPGFTVGQITPSIWAVGSRGLTDRFANDLLVLIDGRTVYDPLFSGVFWNVQDVLFEDLDRIEVIRGPGATLWGSNAVNGVVNITTKSARDTQGLYLTGGGGNHHQGFGAVRYGGEINENAHFRVWAKYDNYANFEDVNGRDTATDWDMVRGGFRFDIAGEDDLEITIQGDLYTTPHADDEVRIPVPGHFTFERAELNQQYQGGNVLARIGRTVDEQRGWSVQTYYDRTKTRGGQPGFEVRRDTIDLDYRQHIPLGAEDEHILMWGLGYRYSNDRTSRGPYINFDPRSRSLDTFTAFIQDTYTILPDQVFLMVGSKFEHNDFTGFEFQPSGRLSWTPDEDQTVWGAASRAVRTPSRIAEDSRLLTAFADPGLLPGGGGATGTFVPLFLLGDDDVDSEELISFELGYRRRLTDNLTIDLATFYNDYDDLLTLGLPAGTIGNRGEANTYGVEVASTWDAADNWRLSAAYTFIRIDFDSVDGTSPEGETPRHQFNLRSYLDITENLELNSALYYVDNIPDEGADKYIRLDVGMTWRPTPNLEFAVWGQNLLDPQHFEFGDDLFEYAPQEVERSIYGQITLRF